MKSLRVTCLSAFFCLLSMMLCHAPARAQFTTARLGGIVTDSSGAAAAGATVTVEEVQTGYKQALKTGSAGEYLFSSLPVGNYQLTVDSVGFAPYVQKGIILTVGQYATNNVQLKVGAVSQQVNVNANASLVTTESAAVGQMINQQSVVNLPLNGRAVQQLVFLIPGALNVTGQNCAGGCEGGTFPTEQYAKVNGGGANGLSYLLDGVDFNDTYINANLPFPNPDAVQEFNVSTNNMSAVYGNAAGGVVNVVTKSGTDRIHGSAFEFIRNYDLDARNYFATSPDPLKQNQFGGSIGGPILKRRLFYFGSYQGTRTNTASNGEIQFVPTAAERTGDFSDLLPATQLVNPNTGVPYVNNQIPQSQLSPVALYLLNHIPLPNGPGRQLTFNAAGVVQNTDEYLIKSDFNAGNHHLSGHFFWNRYDVPIFMPPSSNILEINANPAQTVALKNVSVVDIYTISPRFLLSSYFGVTHQDGASLSNIPFNMADAGSDIAQPASLPGGKGPGMDIRVSGGVNIGGSHYGQFNRGDESLREIATFVDGKNSVEFGGEFLRVTTPVYNQYEQDGIFSFSNSLSGDNTADFLLGAVSNLTQAGGLFLNLTGINWTLFVQDDFRINPRLTLSAGLRWDPWFPYTDSLGRVGCFEPGAQSTRFPNSPQGLIFGGNNHDAGCPKGAMFNSPWNFGPRLGFAYQATADGKTSVRGGAGYYYQTPNTLVYQQVVGIPPFAPIVSLTDVNFTQPYQSAGVANPFPAEFGPSNPGPTASFPQDPALEPVFAQHFHLATTLTWNLTVERSLGQNMLLRVGYMGSAGTHLSGTGDQESGELQVNPAIYIPGESTEANTQQRRVYPNLGQINLYDSEINSNYNAAQITLEKRFSKGLSFLANYTYSRMLDDFGPFDASAGTNTCTCGRYFDYGPDDGDLTNAFKISGSYLLPRIPVNGFAGNVINGWQVTGIGTWLSGFPFTVFSESDNSFSAIGEDRADLTGVNPVLSHGRSHAALVSAWFNTAAFQSNAIGTFGNSGKNFLRGPRYFDTDAAILKTTDLEKGLSLQFRAEFYNALNNVNFNQPDFGLTDSAFGQLTSANTPRIMQFSLKLLF